MIEKRISIIYAHRNRDAGRIRLSLASLKQQKVQNFEVIFVDYGSRDSLVNELEKVMTDFSFVKFYHLPVAQVLWNKSKALNYGVKNARGDYVFIADIDLIFHPETTQLLENIARPKIFSLFELGYLSKNESEKLQVKYDFSNIKVSRFGAVNGMVLTSKNSLLKINGFDEFFHFYGAEDEDLFSRLETAGYQRDKRKELCIYHQWHQSFSGSDDKLLTENPRMKNIMRINQRHFHFNRDLKITKPLNQSDMGTFIKKEMSERLNVPDLTFRIPNVQSYVEHFLRVELPLHKGQIIKVQFFEDPSSKSLKSLIKKRLGKQTQPYLTMKEVNDIILKEILYHYRDSNYSYKVNDNKNIDFIVEIK